MEYSTILLAAGKGSRTHLDYNKIFYHLDSQKTVLDTSLDVFLNDPDCKQVVLVCAEHEIDYIKSLYADPRITFVIGGDTRQRSVYNGLGAVLCDYVFIHDAARPYLKEYSIKQLKSALKQEDACLLMVPCVDTIKMVEGDYVAQTPPRETMYRAQTPQCFKTSLILQCHKKAMADQRVGTDDAQLVEWYGKCPIRVLLGDEENIKITLPNDLLNE